MDMTGKKLKMKKETCFLCDDKGKAVEQRGFKYVTVNCNHLYDYNSAMGHLFRAKKELDEAKAKEKKYSKAIADAEII